MNPISASLLAWYDLNARELPWRGFHDAYRTWVSESMLQQTRVETVLSYYEHFLKRFPDLPSLAAAQEAEVLKEWEGLGYYSRARNLWNGAKQIQNDYHGIIPHDPAVLKTIHGIGPYTAGAIASIAYEVPVPAVDGNVIRVLSRLYGIRENAADAAVRKHLEAKAASLVPEERPGDYNQAVMDLGATVCIPGTPDCARCPLSDFCDAFSKGDASELPVLPKAVPPKVISYAVLLIRSGDRVLIRQRTEKLLQGLWCFPMIEGDYAPDQIQSIAEKKLHLHLGPVKEAGSARHVFTHRVWQMRLYETGADAYASAPAGYRFVAIVQLKELAFPAAMNSALDVIKRRA